MRIFAVLLAFLRGFWKNVCFFDGNLLVKSWCLRGESWCENGFYLATKKMPRFPNLFLARPIGSCDMRLVAGIVGESAQGG